MRVTRRWSRLGQSGTEYMLLLSVLVLAVGSASYSLVRPFKDGVNELGRDVRDVLMGQSIGGVGRGGSSGGTNGSIPSTSTPTSPSGPTSAPPVPPSQPPAPPSPTYGNDTMTNSGSGPGSGGLNPSTVREDRVESNGRGADD